MSPENIRDALAYIASDPRIDTALITGGDPLARPDMLETLLGGLAEIDHVRKIRVGTRHILFDPGQITDDMCAMLARYNHVQVRKEGWTGRSLSIGVSLNHPDELAPEVAEALQRLMRAGIAIRGQVVLLKGINDDVATLRELLERFVLLGIVPYYLFHCMDVVGTYHLRTSIQKGLDLTAALAARSGVYALTYVCVTPVGKVRLGPGTPLDYNDIEGRALSATRHALSRRRFPRVLGAQPVAGASPGERGRLHRLQLSRRQRRSGPVKRPLIVYIDTSGVGMAGDIAEAAARWNIALGVICPPGHAKPGKPHAFVIETEDFSLPALRKTIEGLEARWRIRGIHSCFGALPRRRFFCTRAWRRWRRSAACRIRRPRRWRRRPTNTSPASSSAWRGCRTFRSGWLGTRSRSRRWRAESAIR